jgi:hypothetical protein
MTINPSGLAAVEAGTSDLHLQRFQAMQALGTLAAAMRKQASGIEAQIEALCPEDFVAPEGEAIEVVAIPDKPLMAHLLTELGNWRTLTEDNDLYRSAVRSERNTEIFTGGSVTSTERGRSIWVYNRRRDVRVLFQSGMIMRSVVDPNS